VILSKARVAASAFLRQRAMRGDGLLVVLTPGPDGYAEIFDNAGQANLVAAMTAFRLAVEEFEALDEAFLFPSQKSARLEARMVFEIKTQVLVTTNLQALERCTRLVRDLILEYAPYAIYAPNVSRIKTELIADPNYPKMIPAIAELAKALKFVPYLCDAAGYPLHLSREVASQVNLHVNRVGHVDRVAQGSLAKANALKAIQEAQAQIGVRAVCTCIYSTFQSPQNTLPQKVEAARLCKQQLKQLNISVPLNLIHLLDEQLELVKKEKKEKDKKGKNKAEGQGGRGSGAKRSRAANK